MGGLKIFHCADLHLGLRFSSYPSEISERLREARFLSLEKMVARANREGCRLFVVAGDLFDTLKVAQRDVARAAKILSGFEGTAAVLPGNHDFHAGAADDFWKHFTAGEKGNVLLLEKPGVYPLAEIDTVLYASPCHSKHSPSHALGWLEGAKRPEANFHIGIAHGSFEGLSPDLQGDYFPMKAADLVRHKFIDLWLLGHIHVPHPLKPGSADRIFYSGTHEPDGFDCRHEGRAWLLGLGADKGIRAESLSTGAFRFREEELSIRNLQDLAAFSARFSPEEGARTLLKFSLAGSLAREEYERLGAELESLKARFFHLRADFSALALELAPADIEREFTSGSFPHRLLSELLEDREALQLAYQLLSESGQGRDA
ncbi:MAG TPA: metallophosphoesterase [Bdellovibrionota bacterium]|jgi:DNA repair exonuclease SbcCD nuclease subunit